MKYLSTGKVYTWAPKETEHLGQRLIAQSASSGQTAVFHTESLSLDGRLGAVNYAKWHQ